MQKANSIIYTVEQKLVQIADITHTFFLKIHAESFGHFVFIVSKYVTTLRIRCIIVQLSFFLRVCALCVINIQFYSIMTFFGNLSL